MIEIVREVSVTIDGEDLDRLQDICGWAKLYADTTYRREDGVLWCGGITEKEIYQARELMEKILDV